MYFNTYGSLKPMLFFSYHLYFVFQLIGLDECLKRIHDMLVKAKENAGLDAAVKLRAIVSGVSLFDAKFLRFLSLA